MSSNESNSVTLIKFADVLYSYPKDELWFPILQEVSIHPSGNEPQIIDAKEFDSWSIIEYFTLMISEYYKTIDLHFKTQSHWTSMKSDEKIENFKGSTIYDLGVIDEKSVFEIIKTMEFAAKVGYNIHIEYLNDLKYPFNEMKKYPLLKKYTEERYNSYLSLLSQHLSNYLISVELSDQQLLKIFNKSQIQHPKPRLFLHYASFKKNDLLLLISPFVRNCFNLSFYRVLFELKFVDLDANHYHSFCEKCIQSVPTFGGLQKMFVKDKDFTFVKEFFIFVKHLGNIYSPPLQHTQRQALKDSLSLILSDLEIFLSLCQQFVDNYQTLHDKTIFAKSLGKILSNVLLQFDISDMNVILSYLVRYKIPTLNINQHIKQMVKYYFSKKITLSYIKTGHLTQYPKLYDFFCMFIDFDDE
jgi:hypothetical protein